MNNQQPQGVPINPTFIIKEQSQTIHVLTEEVVNLRAFTAQLMEENAQLKATIQDREGAPVAPKEKENV
ncbi:hypothetical protein CHOTACABRAS_92 [Bacillus phage Chotacabras]|nr:hypothetical protein CHOTACABRAS_92 [Bacillus phage Chotacabras]